MEKEDHRSSELLHRAFYHSEERELDLESLSSLRKIRFITAGGRYKTINTSDKNPDNAVMSVSWNSCSESTCSRIYS